MYNIDDIIFLNRRYIKIARSFNKFDNKKLNLFKIISTIYKINRKKDFLFRLLRVNFLYFR